MGDVGAERLGLQAMADQLAENGDAAAKVEAPWVGDRAELNGPEGLDG